MIHTLPISDIRNYHWHIEIIPRLTVAAGFELGTGVYINPVPPELAASVLRIEWNSIERSGQMYIDKTFNFEDIPTKLKDIIKNIDKDNFKKFRWFQEKAYNILDIFYLIMQYCLKRKLRL